MSDVAVLNSALPVAPRGGGGEPMSRRHRAEGELLSLDSFLNIVTIAVGWLAKGLIGRSVIRSGSS